MMALQNIDFNTAKKFIILLANVQRSLHVVVVAVIAQRFFTPNQLNQLPSFIQQSSSNG